VGLVWSLKSEKTDKEVVSMKELIIWQVVVTVICLVVISLVNVFVPPLLMPTTIYSVCLVGMIAGLTMMKGFRVSSGSVATLVAVTALFVTLLFANIIESPLYHLTAFFMVCIEFLFIVYLWVITIVGLKEYAQRVDVSKPSIAFLCAVQFILILFLL
jgi:hypothetical protein